MIAKRIGFAAMGRAEQRALASKGGKAIKPENRTFSRDPEKARAAGRLGGLKSKRPKVIAQTPAKHS